jgi:heme/copper-type cytochrome/quinol oxidase subunit 2
MVKPASFIVALPLCAILLGGCSSGQPLAAIPEGLDLAKVPVDSIAMTAEHFHFTPDEIHVKEGTMLVISIKALDGTHGFAISDFGINEEIEEGQTKTVRWYARGKGEVGFHCSHLCGMGHLGMNGKIIVE